MSETFKIRLAARCSAAGRPENEDNFQVAEDLSVSNAGFTTDKIFPLGSKGTLLLVCDGMGGMNAGEVASAIGVETIKDFFAPQMINNEVIANDNNICAYMKQSIVKADSRIKEEAQKDSAKQGMGSTAVMAWLLGQKVYVAWCGDSRCYRFNPSTGLEQLSHDHSYVQDLVDTGQLTPELAFDHPNKNIITRSLGDPRGAARPDAKVFSLHAGDVILLCSDGLNDSLRDSQIEQAISRSLTSMGNCLATLWSDSNMAGWHDNVTIVLAQVMDENSMSAAAQADQTSEPVLILDPAEETVKPERSSSRTAASPFQKSKAKIIAAAIFAAIVVVVATVLLLKNNGATKPEEPKQIAKQVQEYRQKLNELENFNLNDFGTDDVISRANDWVNNYHDFVKFGKDKKISTFGEDTSRVRKKIDSILTTRVDELNVSVPGCKEAKDLNTLRLKF